MRAYLAAAGILATVLVAGGAAAAKTLDFYFIDVEGGQSTLIVTPAGESLLVDTGYAVDGRDAARILAAIKDAGISRIDYLLLTHFHPDHDGGIVELSRKIPIDTFFDHGSLDTGDARARADPQWPAYVAAFNAYTPIRATGRHIQPKPGDRLPLKGVDAVWVASATATIDKPLPGAGGANPACGPSAPPSGEPFENPRSTGFHLRFGQFRFVDLGDLSGDPLFALFCPTNLIGPVDLYLLPHHGGSDTTYPATFAAVKPRVAIVNNGAVKGGSPEALAGLRHVAGLEDVFQLHRSRLEGADNFADSRIANLDETTGHWIKASASEDGSFHVTNGRTGMVKSYGRRRQ
jgi:competence protein ComEC